MTDNGNISEEELAQLLGGLDLDEELTPPPVMPADNVPAAPAAPPQEKVLSQAEIDALLASMNSDSNDSEKPTS